MPPATGDSGASSPNCAQHQHGEATSWTMARAGIGAIASIGAEDAAAQAAARRPASTAGRAGANERRGRRVAATPSSSSTASQPKLRSSARSISRRTASREPGHPQPQQARPVHDARRFAPQRQSSLPTATTKLVNGKKRAADVNHDATSKVAEHDTDDRPGRTRAHGPGGRAVTSARSADSRVDGTRPDRRGPMRRHAAAERA